MKAISEDGALVLWLTSTEARTIHAGHRSVSAAFRGNGIGTPKAWSDLLAACTESATSPVTSDTGPQWGNSEEWVTSRVAATRLGINERSVRRRCERDALTARRKGRRWLIYMPEGTT